MIRRLVSPKLILIFTLLVLLGAILVVSYSALSASNSIPLTRLGLTTRPITPNDLKPDQCSPITVTNIVNCTGGACFGTDANDLIFGTTGADVIRGGKGDDCILGGDGDDTLRGEQGDYDYCVDVPGTDFHPSCEFTPVP